MTNERHKHWVYLTVISSVANFIEFIAGYYAMQAQIALDAGNNEKCKEHIREANKWLKRFVKDFDVLPSDLYNSKKLKGLKILSQYLQDLLREIGEDVSDDIIFK